MILKTCRILSLVIISVLLLTGAAMAELYLADVGASYGWTDINKSGSDDSLACWAAAASNMLWYTGWNANFVDQEAIFDHFLNSWTDSVGNPHQGIQWWFDGDSHTMPGSGTVSIVTPDQGDFYGFDPALPGAGESIGKLVTYLGENPNTGDSYRDTMMDRIAGNVESGRAIALHLTNDSSIDHFITVWGYDDASFDWTDWGNGEFIGDADNVDIYVTDSDFGTGLDTINLFLDSGKWYLPTGYGADWGGGYWIEDVTRLAVNSQNIQPIDDDDDPNPVPEPATLLLLGTGIVTFAGIRRKRR